MANNFANNLNKPTFSLNANNDKHMKPDDNSYGMPFLTRNNHQTISDNGFFGVSFFLCVYKKSKFSTEKLSFDAKKKNDKHFYFLTTYTTVSATNTIIVNKFKRKKNWNLYCSSNINLYFCDTSSRCHRMLLCKMLQHQ